MMMLEKAGRVKRAMEWLNDPQTKLFLNCILPAMNHFCKLFQADETRISYLLPDMPSLLPKLTAKFIQMKHVKSTTDVREVKFELAENQHDDER